MYNNLPLYIGIIKENIQNTPFPKKGGLHRRVISFRDHYYLKTIWIWIHIKMRDPETGCLIQGPLFIICYVRSFCSLWCPKKIENSAGKYGRGNYKMILLLLFLISSTLCSSDAQKQNQKICCAHAQIFLWSAAPANKECR